MVSIFDLNKKVHVMTNVFILTNLLKKAKKILKNLFLHCIKMEKDWCMKCMSTSHVIRVGGWILFHIIR